MIKQVKSISLFLVSVMLMTSGYAAEFPITQFGAKGDGTTLNTIFIQRAIDKAAESGAGTVIVPAGRFVSGTIRLKSGITFRLDKNAVLLGSTNRLDYGSGAAMPLILAENARNIRITGTGTIDGRGRELVEDLIRLLKAGTIKDSEWPAKRPSEKNRPKLIAFIGCSRVTVTGITVRNGACWIQDYIRCDTVRIDRVTVMSRAYWNNDGIDIVNSKNVSITNCDVNTSDDAIVLKSEGEKGTCENVFVANCRLSSSANAFKLGTGSHGGFRNIHVRNLKVYDTYRSAVALEAVDGGFLENVDIEAVHAKNTGNAFFIRLGHRNKDSLYSTVKNIRIANLYVEVPSGKPDKGLALEGPLLRYPPGILPAPKGVVQSVSPWNLAHDDTVSIVYPHNVFPSSITGLPGHLVENVLIEDVEVVYEGGASKDRAYFPLTSLKDITEAASSYPEFSMFGELPCWGLFVRHVSGLTLKNVTMRYKNEDFRTAMIFDDVRHLVLKKVNIPTFTSLPKILFNNVSTLTSYVQPLSGTAPSTTVTALKHSEAGSEKNANTIPAVAPPFAMTQWTPQTRQTENKCVPSYFYRDTLLTGFRGTHWLSGSCTQDYGSFTVMPVQGRLRTKIADYSLPFSHSNEQASPHKYTLLTGDLKSEITATLRSGLMRFTLQKADSLYLLIMPNSDKAKGFVKIDASKGEIWGYNPAHRIYQGLGEPTGFSGWFFIKLEKNVGRKGSFRAGTIASTDSIILAGDDAGIFAGFSLQKNESLTIRIGTSFTSLEGAKKNLEAETAGKTFDEIASETEQVWEQSLGQVNVTTGSEKDKRILYTALYHSMQHPRLFSDVSGTYPKFASGELKKLSDGNYYDDFSMWDIYRAQLPLVEILRPKLANDLVRSVILKGQQGGWLPVFPCWNSYTAAMIGDHTTAFIASAYNRGIRNYDVQEAYRLMRKNAFESATGAEYLNGMGRRVLTSYLKYHYIPMEDSVQEAFHKKEQVSRTLEYAFDDYALSVVAKSLGKSADYKILRERSLNYRNVFDPSVNMVRGRFADGSWWKPFKPDLREPYITEGTPRQYTFYVPHDVQGLASLMGGQAGLERSLDSLFLKNEYWHGNEPGHQIPFLYNFTPSPWKTQREVSRILKEEYTDGPGGLSGNDDAGQMSAWYVFASLGFYPVDPVSGDYQLCVPLFDRSVISVEGDKKFEVVRHRTTSNDVYISKVTWNGKTYLKNFITHAMISGGGKLEIWLVDKPTS